MAIKFSSIIIVLARSVDLELDPSNIFLLPAGTMLSSIRRQGIGGTLREETVFLPGYSVLSAGSALL